VFHPDGVYSHSALKYTPENDEERIPEDKPSLNQPDDPFAIGVCLSHRSLYFSIDSVELEMERVLRMCKLCGDPHSEDSRVKHVCPPTRESTSENAKKGPAQSITKSDIPVFTDVFMPQLTFPGGVCRSPPSFKEQIRRLGLDPDQYDLYFEPFSVFDTESLLKRRDVEDFTQPRSLNTVYQHLHELFSVSTADFLSGETKIFVNENTNSEFIVEWLKHLLECADRAKEFYLAKLQPLFGEFTRIEESIEKSESESPKLSAQVNNLRKALLRHASSYPVCGFNSRNYDIVSLRSAGAFYHLDVLDGPIRVLKRGGRYISVTSRRLRFLDVLQYMGPGCSLSGYLKSFAPKDDTFAHHKSFFPYGRLNSLRDLDRPLPVFEDFIDELAENGTPFLTNEFLRYKELLDKGTHQEAALEIMKLSSPPKSARQTFKDLLKEWKDNGVRDMRGLLHYYSTLDTAPFMRSLQIHRRLFFENFGLDFLKFVFSQIRV